MKLLAWVVIALTIFVSARAETVAPAAQSFSGRWQGTLDVSVEMRMVVRMEEHSSGNVQCLVNFIERQPEPYLCGSVMVSGDRVTFSVANLGRVEAALVDGNAVMAGTFTFPNGRTRPLRLVRTSDAGAWPLDPGPHKQSFVTASDGTKLEVLDFGGEGAALIFVAGLGTTGHAFDTFAPRFTDSHRVIAVTRRGAGESGRPAISAENYSSRRLGDDLLEIMSTLKIDRAILAGWSIGGVELSSVASRFPNRVAGLIYLDAAYAYAFYAPGNEQDTPQNVDIAFNHLHDRIEAARSMPPDEAARTMDEILRVALPDLAYDIARNRDRLLEVAAMPPPAPPPSTDTNPAITAVLRNVERFPPLTPPILAIYAEQPPPPNTTERQAAMLAQVARQKAGIISRFKAAHPHAKVLVLKNAQHAMFLSNPDEVHGEMRGFLNTLAK